ncbi:MAG: hypothetical protein E7370_01040 [Clostridiales bacterium]|nr:hypothetical protein [Clostridiales bacterium]
MIKRKLQISNLSITNFILSAIWLFIIGVMLVDNTNDRYITVTWIILGICVGVWLCMAVPLMAIFIKFRRSLIGENTCKEAFSAKKYAIVLTIGIVIYAVVQLGLSLIYAMLSGASMLFTVFLIYICPPILFLVFSI